MINNRLLAIMLSFGLVVGLVTPAFAQTTDGNAVVDISGLAAPAQAVPVDCDVDSGDIVAINTSNGFSAVGLNSLITDLEAEGFVVRTVDLSNGIPECVVKLMIAGTVLGSCVAGTFNQNDLDTITAFVSNGGGLGLFNELSFCSGTNVVAQEFGETPNANSVFTTYSANTNWNPANPATLWDGVNDWQYAAGTTYQSSPDAVATNDPFPGDDPVMITKNVGAGCVLMNGDGDWIQDNSYGNADNAILGVNIFQFLNECISPVGGELLPIDSTALMLAGLQSSAIWMLPVLAGTAGVGAYYIRSRMNRE